MFKDHIIEQKLTKNGYVVIDAHLETEVSQLLSYINENFNLSSSDFYYSLLSNSYEKNIELQKVIRTILNNFYRSFFEDHRILTPSFLSKPANTPAELLLHQDWCYTDEQIFSAYNIWIPLDDVTESNGAMVFLPGSHAWFDNLRSTTLPTARISSSYFLRHGIKAITMKKGQALVFHPAAFHGSCPNLSAQSRIVVTSTVMPKDAPFLYYQRSNSSPNEVSVLHLDDEAFLRDLNSLAMNLNPDYPEIKRIKYAYSTINEDDLKARFHADNLIYLENNPL